MKTDSTLGEEVRKAIAEGRHVHESVRNITLKALTQRELDQEALGKVTRQVVGAVREAAEVQGPGAKQALKEAIEGIDEALAHAAQALKLSLEEAAGRAGKFSREDLSKARNDLGDMEHVFLDTLREAARAGRGAASAIFDDLASHARSSGTAVGKQLQAMGPVTGRLAEAGRAQFEAGLSAAAASSAMLARVASGVLAGIADTLAGKVKRPPN